MVFCLIALYLLQSSSFIC